MEQVTIDKLYEDFEVAIKPGQGFKYVRTREILDRLNKTFEGNWGVQVKHHELIGDEVLVLVSVHIYNADGHVLATQEGFGSAKKFDRTEIGNTYKSATSKAIKSAVRNWGVALFLEEDNVSTQGAQPGRSNSSMPNMSNGPSSMPSTPQGPPSNTGMPQAPPPSGPPSTPSMPSAPPSSTPEGMSTPNTPAPSGNVPPPPSNTAPPSSGNVPPSSNGLPSMSAVPGAPPAKSGNETHSITAVQKVAITSRLGAKGLTFEQIAEEFYTGKDSQVPETIDGMLYVDALDMVAFLNTK